MKQITHRSQGNNNGGRSARKLAGLLREAIESGQYPAGEFLPPLRRLAEEHSVAYMTAVRAMKLLEREGLVSPEPRQGYRVRLRANDPGKGCPIALMPGGDLEDPQQWTPTHKALFTAFQAGTAKRGWSTLTLVCAGRSPEQIIAELKAHRVGGAALDSHNLDVIAALKLAGIPTVLVDAWAYEGEVDGAVQDNHRGGFLAGKYLVEQGCKRIAWAGPIIESVHSHERYGGAAAALRSAGLDFPKDMVMAVSSADSDLKSMAHDVLSRSDRPDGIIALWHRFSVAIKTVTNDLGLVLGRDLHMVGWSVEENYDSVYKPMFGGGPVPAVITWSVREMAEAALDRLAERRLHPDMPPVRINVATRLKFET